jgi:hypothetical protein
MLRHLAGHGTGRVAEEAGGRVSTCIDMTGSMVPRATRLRITAPVAWRSLFDDRWSRGSTLDMSRTGILFLPAEPGVRPGADLQMVVYLSRATRDPAAEGVPMPDLYCGGRLARMQDDPATGRQAVAVEIDFQWAEAPPGRLWQTGL